MDEKLQCVQCGSLEGVENCAVAGETLPLCPKCRRAALAQEHGPEADVNEKRPINYLTGTLGALLGSFIGMLLTLLFLQIGKFSIVIGIALGFLTVFGFKKLGCGLGVGGFLICAIISMAAAYLAMQCHVALLVAKESQANQTTFLEALRILPELKTRGFLNMDSYNKILNALLLDTGFGLVFTLFPWRKKKTESAEEKV